MAKKKKRFSKTKTFFLCLLFIIVGLVLGATSSIFIAKAQEKSDQLPSEEFSIHFLELGNEYTGDSIYIKAGNNDILIDAGSRENSGSTLVNYLNKFVTDQKLEFVIATHADTDHISAFSGPNGIFANFEVETIIDFNYSNKTTATYQKYLTSRDNMVAKGTKHYTASECVNNQNGAQKIYELGTNITMEILDQKFYYETTGDENDYSVCTLFTAGSHKFLLTGDLEKKGEASLIEKNGELIKDCTLFKAGHHGSKTSSTLPLLDIVKPKISVVTCVAGSDQYTSNNDNQFPTQIFCDNIAKYTDQVYVTSMATKDQNKVASMNGNIVVSLVNGEVKVECSNNSTLLKDTTWFKENRRCPLEWTNEGLAKMA